LAPNTWPFSTNKAGSVVCANTWAFGRGRPSRSCQLYVPRPHWGSPIITNRPRMTNTPQASVDTPSGLVQPTGPRPIQGGLTAADTGAGQLVQSAANHHNCGMMWHRWAMKCQLFHAPDEWRFTPEWYQPPPPLADHLSCLLHLKKNFGATHRWCGGPNGGRRQQWAGPVAFWREKRLVDSLAGGEYKGNSTGRVHRVLQLLGQAVRRAGAWSKAGPIPVSPRTTVTVTVFGAVWRTRWYES